jgi:hypothetical protein
MMMRRNERARTHTAKQNENLVMFHVMMPKDNTAAVFLACVSTCIRECVGLRELA